MRGGDGGWGVGTVGGVRGGDGERGEGWGLWVGTVSGVRGGDCGWGEGWGRWVGTVGGDGYWGLELVIAAAED